MYSEAMLTELYESVRGRLSEKRFRHTAEVEKMAARLGELYCPEEIPLLRAAALLHDLTKEYPTGQQIALCARAGLPVTDLDRAAPKTFHARTAAALIPEEYPAFADERLLSCVRWHTTGREGMTLCEKLIYLADYIDLSRTFPDCVTLRNAFFDPRPETMTERERNAHLRDILILSFDMTLRGLLDEGTPASPDTVKARNALLVERLREQ